MLPKKSHPNNKSPTPQLSVEDRDPNCGHSSPLSSPALTAADYTLTHFNQPFTWATQTRSGPSLNSFLETKTIPWRSPNSPTWVQGGPRPQGPEISPVYSGPHADLTRSHHAQRKGKEGASDRKNNFKKGQQQRECAVRHTHPHGELNSLVWGEINVCLGTNGRQS